MALCEYERCFERKKCLRAESLILIGAITVGIPEDGATGAATLYSVQDLEPEP